MRVKYPDIEPKNVMEMEQKSAENKMQKRPILMALIVGCCVAIAINWHRSEIKKAVEQATSQSQSAEFPYTLEAVERVLDEQLSGWNNGNIDQFMRGYIQDSTVRFITNKKVKTSWQEITDSYKKGYPNKEAMGKLTFHRDEIRWINETAGISQVIGRWEVIQTKQLAEVPGSISTSTTNVQPSSDLKSRKPYPQFDTLSGRFSLIFIGTKEGPKIQVDHTW